MNYKCQSWLSQFLSRPCLKSIKILQDLSKSEGTTLDFKTSSVVRNTCIVGFKAAQQWFNCKKVWLAKSQIRPSQAF